MCDSVMVGRDFTSTATGRNYEVNYNSADCTTGYVIYLIQDRIGHQYQYVGYTKKEMRKHLNEYRSGIREGRLKIPGLSQHFANREGDMQVKVSLSKNI